jgi:hypothetical protein
LTQVLEALVPFCSNYGTCLQVLSNELDDQHEHNVTDNEVNFLENLLYLSWSTKSCMWE